MELKPAQRLTPAACVTRAFGGDGKVARLLGVARSTVWRWDQPKERGGLGGAVPQAHQRPLLEEARRQGLELSAEDLVLGRDESCP